MRTQRYEITLYIHMANGTTFIQSLPVECADGAQDFMDWFRNPGKIKVWSWQVLTECSIHMLHHSHIVGVDVEGFFEPAGRDSRWYERLWFRVCVRISLGLFRKKINR